MLQSRDGLREVEARLRIYLSRLPLRIEAAALVGSRARGTHWRGSDIDLVIVSPDFEGVLRPHRIDLLLEPWFDALALEPMGFTPAEVLDSEGLYLWDALMDGRPLQDEGVWAEARARLLRRMADRTLERTRGGWREPSR